MDACVQDQAPRARYAIERITTRDGSDGSVDLNE
jgi:hypothetical protein